ncbi:aspartyl/asparaginyl beta-hydroxylase domain-containing protein [Sphingomonas abietis]|uniref:Aspartyl/asparaginyl beta-hydroxylase domain-containing protein n=1 Tax=Sphingomonas abietis TaxID=3012344 RepID=A0ABY7NLH7_9SPHN|nr:aspartyl/asparaginyl beta-hydroxylase domain-containing protein [Sphingomonas abietis]WBO22389.1 aspartyl/asparaginyl beta-hydroxylase domain-containing protein [Sphingomonas abietis]
MRHPFLFAKRVLGEMNPDLHRATDAALARGQVMQAVALLEEGLLTAPGDFAGWMKLAALRRRTGQMPSALDAVNAALAARPNDFVGLLLKGSLHEQLGDADRAAEIYRAVVFHGRAEVQLPAAMKAQLQRINVFLERHRANVESRLALTDTLDDAHRMRARRFADNVLDRRPAYHQEPTHYRYPGLSDIEFFDTNHGELRDRLRRAFPDILAEFHALAVAHADRQRPYVDLAPGQPAAQWSALNRSTDWNAFHLIRYGDHDPVNAAACPRTIAAFAGQEQAVIPGLGPNLMFSLLAPHTHIPSHHGVANFRVVCHLPLIIPPGCRFRVGGDTREWQAGEPWIFDDTIEHEAWNDSNELRVVLIGDLWRPELDDQDRAIVQDLMQAQATGRNLGGL